MAGASDRAVPIDGVLVVDKPRGPTSHDVVAWARRALETRAVGHAGTLDPMASGVLVLGVGEGTKLTSYLMADDKEYETTIALGAETDTLDADGTIVERAPVPALDRAAVEAACARFVGTYLQRAPAISAIKKDGVALHARVRRGEEVIGPEREVRCDAIEGISIGDGSVSLRVRCGKGFYVRSLGRDLARALGTRGHLVALRRIASGAFAGGIDAEIVRRARDEEGARASVRAAIVPLADAIGAMARIVVDEASARDVRHGKRVKAPPPEREGPVAVLDRAGALLAIARWDEGALRVLRGFRAIEAP